ncbi:cation diffusion facilitator family transporter [Staphylococcus massiliensis]|uniref:cation diffusion facilitator family transporter n=1 Tax=Staphylococcus massiliensis TaxID=555791 RepID=UPI00370D34DD
MHAKHNLQEAQKGAYLSLVVYIILSIIKYIVGYIYSSAAIRADSFNNITDILVSIAVLVGLKISIKPPDSNHPYGHLKSENISALLVSFIIMFVGLEVLITNGANVFAKKYETPNPLTIYVSLASGLVMIGIYLYNRQLAEKTKSSSLSSAAKDNLSDGLVSIGTAVGLIFTQFGLPIVDTILACILGLLIMYTGYGIFRVAIFTLSDGFNEKDLDEYKHEVLSVEGVCSVPSVKGRYHGSNVFLDVVITVDPNMTITEAHRICDNVECHMNEQGIVSLYVHAEPDDEAHRCEKDI